MSDQMKHQRNRNRSRPGWIVAAVAAIIAVAAIAVGVRFYEKSGDPSGPLPVHLSGHTTVLPRGVRVWGTCLVRRGDFVRP